MPYVRWALLLMAALFIFNAGARLVEGALWGGGFF